jgi:hypothetical protein
MKRTALAIALAMGASAALAQAPAAPAAAPVAPEVPAAKCEPKPAYPGLKAVQDERKREIFQKDLKSYQDCIRVYVGERKAAVDANNAAMRTAVEEHNAIMTKIRADQDAAVPPDAAKPDAPKK